MSRPVRAFILISALALAILIGFADTVTGLIPDLTVFYLTPVIIATVFVGLPFGLLVAVVAAASELSSNILIGLPLGANVIVDALFHLIVFILGAVLVDKLLYQLRTITEFEQRRSYEIDIARGVHQSIFTPFPEQYRDLVVGGKLAFAGELGGDYYYFSDRGDKLFFCIGDISGKGIAAALFSVMLHESIDDALMDADSLPSIFTIVNTHMCAALPEDMFITLFCAFIDDKGIDFINAGHEPPMLYLKRQNTTMLLESESSFPVGIRSDIDIAPRHESLARGDILLAVTDGVTESPAFISDPFGKLRELLYKNRNAEPQHIVDAVFAETMPDNGTHQSDDIVIACIKRHP